jgi:2-deoxy-D-gluconate 3-dehydrogenase
MNLFDLSGRVAVVTGGNGGIGLGMARGLAHAGANIAVAGRNSDKNAKAEAELKALGVETISVVTDVTKEESCRKMVEETTARFGRLDILLNNAGMNIRKLPEELSLAEWHTVMDTNLTSAFICSQMVFPEMVKAGGGKIVNTGSMMTIFGADFVTPYAASKGGIVQMSRALATAWARHNIQVNAILPGYIDTDMTRMGRKYAPDLEKRVEARTPAGRWGIPDDLSGAAVFLSSAASDFVTGTAIPVDGGYSIQG